MSADRAAILAALGIDESQLKTLFANATISNSPVPEGKGDPAPKATGTRPSADKPDTVTNESPSDAKKEVDRATAPTIETAGDYLALYTRNYIQRDLTKERPTWTPDFRRLFYMTNLYDNNLSQNYYARRQLPAWFPTASRIYIGILCHLAVLRVQYHVSLIRPADADLVERFFELYPPERIPIPGFAMPVFKSLNASDVEDSRYMKPIPHIPNDFVTAATNADRITDRNNMNDYRLPYLPALFWLHQQLLRENGAEGDAAIHFGANDSAGAGRKTVTIDQSADYPFTIDLLSAIPRRYRQRFPFARLAPADVPNATDAAGAQTAIYGDFFGTNQPAVVHNEGDVGNASMWVLAKCGLAEPINVHRDLVTQFKQNYRLVTLPEVDLTATPTTLAEQLGFGEDYHWFSELLEMMGTYCAYAKGSGVLADCSLEGPAVGQYLVNLDAPRTLPPRPTHMGDARSTPAQGGHLSTTRKGEEPIAEALAHHSQVHVRWYATHPHWPNLGSGANRTTAFWQIRPLYTAGTTDTGFALLPSEIKKGTNSRVKD